MVERCKIVIDKYFQLINSLNSFYITFKNGVIQAKKLRLFSDDVNIRLGPIENMFSIGPNLMLMSYYSSAHIKRTTCLKICVTFLYE